MRVISLNAWCGTMWDQLADWVRACDADVLCVQEVTRAAGRSGWVEYDDGEHAQRQRANLFADLSGLMPDHQASFVAHDSGPVLVDGHVCRQDFGMAVFVAAGLPVIGQVAKHILGRFVDHEEAWPASDRPRLAQGIRVWDRTAAREVAIIHVHGVRQTGGKGDSPARLQQAHRLAGLVNDFSADSDLTVMVGDFNILPDSATFDVLAEVGLTDLVGDADTRTSAYAKPVRHANYALVSDPGAVIDLTVVTDPEVSDHRPLVLEV